jgi:hypothetical protein
MKNKLSGGTFPQHLTQKKDLQAMAKDLIKRKGN